MGPASEAVDVVGVEHRSHHLLEGIQRLAGQPGRGQAGTRLPMFQDRAQAPRDIFQRMVPGRRLQVPVLAHHGLLQPVAGFDVIETVAALDAEQLLVDAGVRRGGDPDQATVAQAGGQHAAGAAVGADRIGLGQIPDAGLVTERGAHQRADRAGLDAVAAVITLCQVVEEPGLLGVCAATHTTHGSRADDLLADPDAALALDAAVGVLADGGAQLHVAPVQYPFAVVEMLFVRAVGEHQVLQFALAGLVADRAVQRVVGEDEFEHRGPCTYHVGRSGLYGHAIDDRGHAGRLQLALADDLDQAEPAGGTPGDLWQGAEGRDGDPGLGRRLQNWRAVGSLQFLAVDGYCGHD